VDANNSVNKKFRFSFLKAGTFFVPGAADRRFFYVQSEKEKNKKLSYI